MTQVVVATVTLAESGTTEEAVNERIEDAQFAPQAPLSEPAAAYVNTTEYAVGALVSVGAKAYAAGTTYKVGELAAEGGIVYEAIKEETKGEAPSSHPKAWRRTGLASQVFRNTEAKNKEHPPLEDTDFAHWVPAGDANYLLQNPAFVTNAQFGTLRTRYEIIGAPTNPAAYIYPYEAAKKYKKGEYAVEGGVGYEALAATEGEAPSSHEAAWRNVGPAISLG